MSNVSFVYVIKKSDLAKQRFSNVKPMTKEAALKSIDEMYRMALQRKQN
ncbi:hypothetical protein JOC36_001533 [Weissella uvarum]|nr:hypothetical protein [Weissella uvarum]MBM7617940.1 hypothetical protein [Weissella uvarum]MCM0595247.1 hypothetical protein [Weissella uvarum]